MSAVTLLQSAILPVNTKHVNWSLEYRVPDIFLTGRFVILTFLSKTC